MPLMPKRTKFRKSHRGSRAGNAQRGTTVAFGDFMAYQGWKGAREKGLVRSEGKEYIVNDGDVMLFRFNV